MDSEVYCVSEVSPDGEVVEIFQYFCFQQKLHCAHSATSLCVKTTSLLSFAKTSLKKSRHYNLSALFYAN